jgi:ferritin-like metal-binding protein YciE
MSQQKRSVNEKFVEHLNEMLSMENAAEVHLQDRIRETPIEELRKQLGSHLDETKEHQRRLQQLITNRGSDPTDSKAHLPSFAPAATTLAAKTVKDTVTDTIKSVAGTVTGGGSSDNEGAGGSTSLTSQEMELMKAKNDMIKEDAEVISYKLMIKTAERLGLQDAIPPLRQTLQEEERMAGWLMDNSSLILDYHWSKIEAALTGRNEEDVKRERSTAASSAGGTAA